MEITVGKMEGFSEMRTVLRSTDRKLFNQTTRAIRQAGAAMVAQARAFTPTEAPLSGWAHKGRTGWRQTEVLAGITIRVGGSRLSSSEWMLASLQQKNPAGMIYDWAGRTQKGKRQLRQFVNLLPRLGSTKGSQHSRVLFPAFVSTRAEVTRAMMEAVETVARQVNMEIGRI
jgi:hypothetical protein